MASATEGTLCCAVHNARQSLRLHKLPRWVFRKSGKAQRAESMNKLVHEIHDRPDLKPYKEAPGIRFPPWRHVVEERVPSPGAR
jgi:hypothetical protein